MTNPIYPRGDLDDSRKMLGVLGSYWATQFPDNDVLGNLYTGRSLLFEQTSIDTDETKDIVSRYTCPDYHNKLWNPMYFRRNSAANIALTPLKYGADRALYGEEADQPPFNKIFNYGQSLVEGDDSAFVLPSGLVQVRIMVNRISNPTLVLVEGVDFKVDPDNNVIAFSIDLFNDPRVATRDVIDADTGEADTEALLWAFSSDIDLKYMWTQFGYIINFDDNVRKNYKDFVNAVWDMHTGAPTISGLTSALSAIWDVPVAKEDEIVEVILTGTNASIITNKNVYKIHPDSTVIVDIGDELVRYDRLVDTFEIVETKYIDDGLHLKKRTPISNEYNMSTQVASSMDRFISGGPNFTTEVQNAWDPFLITQAGVVADYRDYFTNSALPDGGGLLTSASLNNIIKYRMHTGIDVYYHGPYINQAVTVTKATLPEHTSITLKFDLLVIGAWTGNLDTDLVWTLKIDGETLLSTNFSNGVQSNKATLLGKQAYPGAIGSDNPSFTGSVYNDFSSPKWLVYQHANNSQYTLEFTVLHNRPSIEVEFSCTGLDDTDVTCVINPVPLTKSGVRAAYYDNTLQEYVEYEPTIYHKIGCYSPTDIAALQAIVLDTDVFGNPVRTAWTDLLAGFPKSSHRVYNVTTGGNGERIDGRLTYPKACWGIQNMYITTLNSNLTDIPNFPPQIVNNPDVRGITLGRRFLSDTYFSTLYFQNKEVDLEYVGEDADGRVEVRFEVNGYPGDVEQYWNNTMARGKVNGYTLANYLDQRDNPIDDPSPNDLPDKVNPMLLVLRHLMSYNLIIIKMKTGLEGERALDPKALDYLRDIIPPQTGYIIFMDIRVGDEDIDTPLTEEIATGVGPLIVDTVDVTLEERDPVVNVVKGAFIKKQL